MADAAFWHYIFAVAVAFPLCLLLSAFVQRISLKAPTGVCLLWFALHCIAQRYFTSLHRGDERRTRNVTSPLP